MSVNSLAEHAVTASRTRPIIGVTGPDRGGESAWLFTWIAIALAGASARWITPRQPCRIEDLDGLILGGGADVDPRLYGEAFSSSLQSTAESTSPPLERALEMLLLPMTWFVRQILARSSDDKSDVARDRMELQLIEQAVAQKLPILGICRGAQLLNVAFGGTLHQSLTGFYIETRDIRSIRPRKRIELGSGSKLTQLMGKIQWVNSLHRQAVDRLGTGLRISATDRNGIVQAIEHEVMPFIVGVQWHPEFLPQRRAQRGIFRALVAAARTKRA